MANDLSETADAGADSDVIIRRAASGHLDQIVDLDARITGLAKPDYWADIFERYGTRRTHERFFLVAESPDEALVGMIAGEVRGWEFGSQPCGWVFMVSVDPEMRGRHVGERLFRAICDEFRRIGIDKVRTMVRRQDRLNMAFFRAEGMVAGPYIQLELDLDEDE